MLVLSDADGFRVDLYQFCQRVHQPATDRDCSTHRYVIIGKFIAGDLGCRINGSSLLADYEDRNLPVESLVIDEVFRLAAGCSVADRDGFNLIGFYHFAEFGSRFAGFIDRRVGIDVFIVQQIALRIQTDYFTACAEARIDSEYPFLSERRREEQLAEILRKHADSFVISLFFGLCSKLCFNGRFEQTLVGIGSGFAYLTAAFIVAVYELAVEAFQTGFVIRTDGYFQQSFGFCAANGEETMGGAAFQ